MNAPTDNINDAGPHDAILEPLGSDGPDDVAPDADADALARSRGDAADEHTSFTVDRDDPREDDGGDLMPKEEPL